MNSKKLSNFIIATVVLTWLYALVRYIIFKHVAFAQLPLYVTNKAIALSAIIFIAAATLKTKNNGPDTKLYLSSFGFFLALIHVIISIILLEPDYFPKLFAGGKFNIFGELSILFGILAFTAFIILLISTTTREYLKDILKRIASPDFINILGLLFLVFHTFLLGIKGWMTPKQWPGYLPPITLLGFIVAIIPIFKKIFGKMEIDE